MNKTKQNTEDKGIDLKPQQAKAYELPKILIGIVTNQIKQYCQFDFLAQLSNLLKFYPSFEYIIIDNSQTEHNAKEIRSYGFKNVIWHYTKGLKNRVLMAECNELTRKKAVELDCAFMLSVESDIFFNFSAIPILLAQNLQVVCCPYFTGEYGKKKLLYNVPELQKTDEVNKIKHFKEVQLTFNQGFLRMNLDFERISSAGIGFCLIRRDVLELIKFRVESDDKTSFADSAFFKDVLNAQIPIYMYNDARVVYHHWQTPQGWSNVLKLV